MSMIYIEPHGMILNTDHIVRVISKVSDCDVNDIEVTIVLTEMEEKIVRCYNNERGGAVTVRLHFDGQVAKDLLTQLRSIGDSSCH